MCTRLVLSQPSLIIITDLDAWNAEDETFMELAAKQEAIKRDLAAIAIPSYTLEKPKTLLKNSVKISNLHWCLR